jgi:hypothetical protein
MAHAHVHVPHELTEEEEGHATVSQLERLFELGAVLLLSLTCCSSRESRCAWNGAHSAASCFRRGRVSAKLRQGPGWIAVVTSSCPVHVSLPFL